MIRVHSALRRQVADLFTRHLVGLYSYDDVKYDGRQEKEAPQPARRRRERVPNEGKYEERVEARFGDFYLKIEAPAMHPPLGLVELHHGGALLASGVNDSQVWLRVADAIVKQTRDNENGQGTDIIHSRGRRAG